MKNTIHLSLVLVLFLIAGCKKDEGNTNWQAQAAQAETYRIKKFIFIDTQSGSDTSEYNYTYNADNTVATETDKFQTYNYTYGNQTVQKVKANNGDVYESYHLNSAGFVDTLTYYEDLFFTHTYNDYGNLTSKTYQGLTLTYNWSNGNLSSAGSGGMANYDFMTDKFSTINNTNRGMLFKGRESVNLTSRGYGNSGEEVHYTYEFDELQRVIHRHTEISDEHFTYY